MQEVTLDDIFFVECKEFVEMITNGTMLRSYEDLIKPVKMLQAIKTAYETGEKVEIQE